MLYLPNSTQFSGCHIITVNLIWFVDTTRNGDSSKASAKLQKYISRILEKYEKNLEEQIDKEVIRVVAKNLHNWDAMYDLFELDYNEVKDIKEENSSVSLQR